MLLALSSVYQVPAQDLKRGGRIVSTLQRRLLELVKLKYAACLKPRCYTEKG
jgi:hypothetical protein